MTVNLLFENWRKYLLIEYSIKDGQEKIGHENKRMHKVYKRYLNRDWHEEVERGWLNPKYDPEPHVAPEKIAKVAWEYKSNIFELIPQDIAGPYAANPEQKEREADKNQGIAIMWLRKLSIENPKIAKDIIDGWIGRVPAEYDNLMPDFELYFQNINLMPKKNLMEIGSFEELHQMVEDKKEEIDKARLANIANPGLIIKGTTFLSGDWSKDIGEIVGKALSPEEQREWLKDLETEPGRSGWAIMEIHNKAASCFHGTVDWCTAMPKQSWFEDYYAPDNPLFIFEGSWSDPAPKFQFHYGSESFMDAGDRPVNKETFKTLHNLLMRTEAPEKYQAVQDKQYEIIAGDSDTPAEELNEIIELYLQRRSSGWGSNIIEKVAKNAKTPLESLKKLYHSTDNKYITRSIQVNPVIDFALAKEILMSNPKDELIYARGIKQMTDYKRWGISFEEINKIINAVEAARNYEPRQIPQEVANLYEHKLKIRIKK